jgi:hypothetical protein
MARRRGKIARLPDALRDELNRRLLDGELYKKIGGWLAEKGHGGIDKRHLSVWFHGGYQEWLKAQARVAQDAADREQLARFLTNKKGKEVEQANLQLASLQMFDAMRGLTARTLVNMTRKKPELFFKMVGAIVLLNKQSRKKSPEDGGK